MNRLTVNRKKKLHETEIPFTAELLPLSSLYVDKDFVQREEQKNHIKDIVANFDYRGLMPLIVNRRGDGTLSILDGQQKRIALLEKGYTDYCCIVYKGMSKSEEAKIFNILAKRKNIQPNTLFRNKVNSGDPQALVIYACVQLHGFDIHIRRGRPSSDKDFIKGIATLEKIVGDKTYGGVQVLDNALRFIREVFEIPFSGKVQMHAKKDMFLRGVAIFLSELNETSVDTAISFFKKYGQRAYDIEQKAVSVFGDSRKGLDKAIAVELHKQLTKNCKKAKVKLAA